MTVSTRSQIGSCLAAALVLLAQLVGCTSTSADSEASTAAKADDTGREERSADDDAHETDAKEAKPADAARPVKGSAVPDAGTRGMASASAERDAGGKPSGASGLPCDVQAIVEKRCGTCHGSALQFGAPLSLTSLADFQGAGTTDKSKKVYELVKLRINATAKMMPPPGSPELTDEERGVLNGWLDAGALGSEEHCTEGAGSEPGTVTDGSNVDVSGLECHKFVAHAQGNKSAKYKVGAAVDVYINMGFAAGWQGVRYGALLRPIVDNSNAIHHWLLYEEPTTDGSIEAGIGQHPSGNLVAGWAPGGPAYDFRKFGDVGLELEGTSYVLELHYNSSDENAEDASGIEICLFKDTPKNIVTYSWVGYDNWFLAGDLGGPRTEWTGTCAPVSQEPIHILYVTPHMHKTGRHLKSIINEPGGGQRTLHDEPFDFEYQSGYEKEEILMPGETITTTCTFSQPMLFGQGTNDEMCYLFTYHYPRNSLVDNGAWGAFAHGEGTCLGQ